LQEYGYPIIDEKKYGGTQNPIYRLGLHAKALGFIHPITKKPMRFETPLPRNLPDSFNRQQRIVYSI
jgi:23S rRNA pseudouridine1911/1915/1917 synthase